MWVEKGSLLLAPMAGVTDKVYREICTRFGADGTVSNPDSEVILSNPGYACYRNFVLATPAKPVLVPLSKEYLQYDIEAIRKCVNPHTAAIFINSQRNIVVAAVWRL